MKGLRIFLATFALTITIGALAQQGGLPSRPRFLSVGVGTSAPTTNGNMNVAGSVTASNFVGNIGGVAPTDFARLSQANTFTNAVPITLSSTTPFLQFTETDAAPSNQHWALFANNEQFRASACVNSGSGCIHWATVDRTAGTIDSINLNASQVGITGSVVVEGAGNRSITAYNQSSGNRVIMVAGTTVSAIGTVAGSPNQLQIRTNDVARISIQPDGSSIDMNATQVAVNGNPVATTASGSFQATLTGMTSTVTGSLGWKRTGNVVTITRSGTAITGTSNATTMSITGLPAEIVPTTTQNVPCGGVRESAIGIGDVMAQCTVHSVGHIQLNPLKADASGYIVAESFTASGTKGIGSSFSVRYTLD